MDNLKGLVKKTVNDEQLIELALSVSAHHMQQENHPTKNIADRVIIAYILMKNGDPNLSDEKITDEYASLITGHILNDGVQKGEIEVTFDDDGEIRYKIPDDQE